ncbi:hypothetical protein HDV06_003694 [Boothiomyces sp. JEL0866]|nr:hypothetical protein HDV06_003694 [Boothiomyces sp. JEL0866]
MISQFDIQEWVDSARDSITSPINDLGTVQINEAEIVPTNIPKLRDLFEPAQPAFMQVFEPENGLFKSKYDTLTRNQLSEIMDTIHFSEKENYGDLDKKLDRNEEYPENIDFLDQQSDEQAIIEMQDQKDCLLSDNQKLEAIKDLQKESSFKTESKAQKDSFIIDSLKETFKISENLNDNSEVVDSPMKFRQPRKLHRPQSDVFVQFQHLETSINNVSNYIAQGVENDLTNLNKTNEINHCPNDGKEMEYSYSRKIESITDNVKDCIDLGNLNLDSLSSFIKENCFRKIVASDNRLKFLDEIPASVETLFISKNELSNLTSFSKLQSLRVLDISYNYLTDLSEYLNLSRNNLDSIRNIHYLANLKELILNSPLRYLLSLDLADNYLVGFDLNPFPRLLTINLSRNCLQKLYSLDNSNLRVLEIESQFSHSLSLNFSNSQIETLKISGNKHFGWESIPLSLEILEAGSCNLRSIPQILLKCQGLKTVIFENNQLSDIVLLESLQSLSHIYLSNNNITDITRACKSFAKLPRLLFLDFRRNQITQEPANQSQQYVYSVIIKMLLINSIKTLKFLDLNPINSRDRRIAQKRNKVIKKIAGEYSSKAQAQWFNNWKPELYPVEDLTVDDELVLQVLN